MKKLFIVNLVLVFLALILQIILPDNTLGLVFLFQLAIFPIIGIFALIFYFSKRKTIGENKTFFYSFLFLLIGIIYFILLNYVFWAKFVEEGQWGLFIVSAIAAFNSSIITWEIIISFFIFIKIRNNFDDIKIYIIENKKKLGLLIVLILILVIITIIFIGFITYIPQNSLHR